MQLWIPKRASRDLKSLWVSCPYFVRHDKSIFSKNCQNRVCFAPIWSPDPYSAWKAVQGDRCRSFIYEILKIWTSMISRMCLLLWFYAIFIKLAFGQYKPIFGGHSQIERWRSVSKLGLRPQRGGRNCLSRKSWVSEIEDFLVININKINLIL